MNRYSTQEILIGKDGQKNLKEATAAIVGLGALGSLSAQLLARAGIGKLILIDRDYVELNNLHRQFFREEDIGKAKAEAMAKLLKEINSEVRVEAHFDNLDYTNAEKLLLKADLILDCTDNLETRFLINDFSLKKRVPFIYAAALAESGYIFTIMPGETCFNCIFGKAITKETCETTGVLNTITSAISVLQANQAMKIILQKEVDKELFYFNSAQNRIEKIKVSKNPECEACNGIFKYLSGEKGSKIVKFCGSQNYLIRGKFNYVDLKNKLAKVSKANGIKDFGNAFLFKDLTIFADGRALIKAAGEKEAISLFSRYVGN